MIDTAWHSTALVRSYRDRLLIVIINDSAERIDWSHADLDLTAPWSWSVVNGQGVNLIDGTSPTVGQAQADALRFVDEEARHGH